MIKIDKVSKNLGEKIILKDVSIEVNKGSIFGLIGANGAGKTTLIKCLNGIYKVDSGTIKINDEAVYDNPEIKKIVGYVADENNYFSEFSVENILKFYALSYEKFNLERFNNLNSLFNIPISVSIKKLSKGMKTRLAIMLNLSIMPEIMILDEPTSGLDPLAKKQFINMLLEDSAERNTTIFISSHNLGDLERICDSVAIMDKGEIKYHNSIENMKKNIRKLQVVFNGEAPSDLTEWDNILKVEKIGRVYNIITSIYDKSISEKVKQQGVVLLEEIDMSLEDIFIYSIGGEINFKELF